MKSPTPPPAESWTAEPRGDGFFHVFNQDSIVVADRCVVEEAVLIGAAPRMLEQCRHYSADCETRVSVLKDELAELGLSLDDEDAADIRDQIEHWQATKRNVDAVIAQAEGR